MHESLIKSERKQEDHEIHASPSLPRENLQYFIPDRWDHARHLIRNEISNTKKILHRQSGVPMNMCHENILLLMRRVMMNFSRQR